jgi:hypothetical protein
VAAGIARADIKSVTHIDLQQPARNRAALLIHDVLPPTGHGQAGGAEINTLSSALNTILYPWSQSEVKNKTHKKKVEKKHDNSRHFVPWRALLCTVFRPSLLMSTRGVLATTVGAMVNRF